MSIKYQFSHDVELVFEQLTDPDFLVKRCVSLGEKNIQCEVEYEGRKTTVELTRTVKKDLPKFLAKLFGDENTMTMVESWEDIGANKIGSYAVEVAGQPVTLSANFTLKPNSEGCEYEITYAAKAKIPMVGKKVEAFILGQTEEGMRQEMDYLKETLG